MKLDLHMAHKFEDPYIARVVMISCPMWNSGVFLVVYVDYPKRKNFAMIYIYYLQTYWLLGGLVYCYFWVTSVVDL